RPLGSNQVTKVDVRLLAASHADLEELVKNGKFREDLYYRVNVLALRLPPLRGRREDIPLLAALSGYDWPGNVRELENEMRRVLLLAEDSVRIEHLTPAILTKTSGAAGTPALLPVVVGDLRSAV